MPLCQVGKYFNNEVLLVMPPPEMLNSLLIKNELSSKSYIYLLKFYGEFMYLFESHS